MAELQIVAASKDFTASEKQGQNANLFESLIHFGQAALHEAFESPINGAIQIVNHTSNAKLHELEIIGAPPPAQAGSLDEFAQKAGSVVGMIAPYLVLRSAVGKTTNEFRTLTGTARILSNPVAQAAVTGAVYDGVFRPVDVPDEDFWAQRAKNATVGAITFGTMEGFYHGMTNKMQSSGLHKIGGIGGNLNIAGQNFGNYFVANPIARVATSAAAGYGAGHVNAQATAFLNQGRLADLSTSHSTASDFALFGGLIAATHIGIKSPHVKGRFEKVKQYFNESKQARAEQRTTEQSGETRAVKSPDGEIVPDVERPTLDGVKAVVEKPGFLLSESAVQESVSQFKRSAELLSSSRVHKAKAGETLRSIAAGELELRRAITGERTTVEAELARLERNNPDINPDARIGGRNVIMYTSEDLSAVLSDARFKYVPQIGQYLKQLGVTEAQIQNALRIQYEQPPGAQKQLLGQILVNEGHATQAQVEAAFSAQKLLKELLAEQISPILEKTN